jgi:hypothetical protein
VARGQWFLWPWVAIAEYADQDNCNVLDEVRCLLSCGLLNLQCTEGQQVRGTETRASAQTWTCKRPVTPELAENGYQRITAI